MDQLYKNGKMPDVSNYVKTLITQEIEKEVVILIEEAKKKLNEKIPQIVAGVSMSFMQNCQMQSFGDVLEIKIALSREQLLLKRQ